VLSFSISRQPLVEIIENKNTKIIAKEVLFLFIICIDIQLPNKPYHPSNHIFRGVYYPKIMSVQTARKVALAYWGFSKKASSRAKSGIDIDIIKGTKSLELSEQAPSIQKFAQKVDDSWEDFTGFIGKYGRIPFEALVDIAAKAKSSNENIGESNMEEVEKWSKLLIDSNPNYFIARANHKGMLLQILINTKN